MKAFLSHSSKDQQLVRAVANELGRQYCHFDEHSFDSGVEFRESIVRGLDESSLFVLFASKHALDSMWVTYEIEEAWYQKLSENIARSLVYVIDPSVRLQDIPSWLVRAKIRQDVSAQLIARDIRHHLDVLKQRQQYQLFVGRNRSVGEMEEAFQPVDGSPPPRWIVVIGLPGIGRRSLIRSAAPKLLGFYKDVEIRIDEGDTVNDVCLKLADRIEPYTSREALKNLAKLIDGLTEEEALSRSLKNLRMLVRSGELPILYDDGGLLDNDGFLNDTVLRVLREIQPNDEVYAVLVTDRRPRLGDDMRFPVVRIDSLSPDETVRLMSTYAARLSLAIPLTSLEELARYADGYPPAAYFAVQQVRDYGMDLVRSDMDRLRQFKSGVFLGHIRNRKIIAPGGEILRLLATYSPLPLPTIGAALGIVDMGVAISSMATLVDQLFVRVTREGHYRISEPIRDTVRNIYGPLEPKHHQEVARHLASYTDLVENGSPQLELLRIQFRAANIAGDAHAIETAIGLVDDLIRLTETMYHNREFDRAATYAKMALEQRPRSQSARAFLIRALIQLERWKEAHDQIEKLKSHGSPRDVHYYKGFLNRRRGDIDAAMKEYLLSQKMGRGGPALHRELGLCYYHKGDYKNAMRCIDEYLTKHYDDPYVLDLKVKFAAAMGDRESAMSALGDLQEVAEPVYYYHRLSRVEFAFGNLKGARDAARQAYETTENPPFEVVATLSYCEMALGNHAVAEKLIDKLDAMAGRTKFNIRTNLRCRLEIERGRFLEALELSESVVNKEDRFTMKVVRDALSGEIQRGALADNVLDDFRQRVEVINTKLAAENPQTYSPDDIEDMSPR
ncbi:TIR domain-containing protein [bacterium]|nr:TIR domain-containing protein [bacterium]